MYSNIGTYCSVNKQYVKGVQKIEKGLLAEVEPQNDPHIVGFTV